jgi:hypothetical protein
VPERNIRMAGQIIFTANFCKSGMPVAHREDPYIKKILVILRTMLKNELAYISHVHVVYILKSCIVIPINNCSVLTKTFLRLSL